MIDDEKISAEDLEAYLNGVRFSKKMPPINIIGESRVFKVEVEGKSAVLFYTERPDLPFADKEKCNSYLLYTTDLFERVKRLEEEK